jgi:hypothetical protein
MIGALRLSSSLLGAVPTPDLGALRPAFEVDRIGFPCPPPEALSFFFRFSIGFFSIGSLICLCFTVHELYSSYYIRKSIQKLNPVSLMSYLLLLCPWEELSPCQIWLCIIVHWCSSLFHCSHPVACCYQCLFCLPVSDNYQCKKPVFLVSYLLLPCPCAELSPCLILSLYCTLV